MTEIPRRRNRLIGIESSRSSAVLSKLDRVWLQIQQSPACQSIRASTRGRLNPVMCSCLPVDIVRRIDWTNKAWSPFMNLLSWSMAFHDTWGDQSTISDPHLQPQIILPISKATRRIKPLEVVNWFGRLCRALRTLGHIRSGVKRLYNDVFLLQHLICHRMFPNEMSAGDPCLTGLFDRCNRTRSEAWDLRSRF